MIKIVKIYRLYTTSHFVTWWYDLYD